MRIRPLKAVEILGKVIQCLADHRWISRIMSDEMVLTLALRVDSALIRRNGSKSDSSSFFAEKYLAYATAVPTTDNDDYQIQIPLCSRFALDSFALGIANAV